VNWFTIEAHSFQNAAGSGPRLNLLRRAGWGPQGV
jgi:hypothetical protein